MCAGCNELGANEGAKTIMKFKTIPDRDLTNFDRAERLLSLRYLTHLPYYFSYLTHLPYYFSTNAESIARWASTRLNQIDNARARSTPFTCESQTGAPAHAPHACNTTLPRHDTFFTTRKNAARPGELGTRCINKVLPTPRSPSFHPRQHSPQSGRRPVPCWYAGRPR